MNLEKLKTRINEIVLEYAKTVTHTGTKLEKNSEEFFNEWFKNLKEISKLPLDYGIYPCKDDYLERSVAYSLIRGKSKKTVVMIHHSDTVDIEDFGKLKDIAYDPEKILEKYKSGEVDLISEVKNDLDGKWMFGRGICDMKAGGSIQMALMEEYSKDENFPGSLLLAAVPDEENLSAGMRTLTYILDDLHKKYDLEYILMLDGEPHMREKDDEMIIYDGSIGKVMPICLARGKLTHVGQVYQGLNPISLISEIISLTDVNPMFIEKRGNTVSPAPTWLYSKDRKYVYDVSLPISAGAYMSVLPLSRTPDEIMNELKNISLKAFDKVIKRTDESYKKYLSFYGEEGEISYPPKVFLFKELVDEVKKEKGDIEEILKDKENDLTKKVFDGEISIPEAVFELIESLLLNYSYRGPVVVWGMCPPYYPSVNNMELESGEFMNSVMEKTGKFIEDEFSLKLKVQNYFTGICDLSLAMLNLSDESIKYVEENLLMWNTFPLALDLIKKYSMSVLNVGPWGKDLHKYTERVNKDDMFKKIPEIMDFIIKEMYKWFLKI